MNHVEQPQAELAEAGGFRTQNFFNGKIANCQFLSSQDLPPAYSCEIDYNWKDISLWRLD